MRKKEEEEKKKKKSLLVEEEIQMIGSLRGVSTKYFVGRKGSLNYEGDGFFGKRQSVRGDGRKKKKIKIRHKEQIGRILFTTLNI
jgi:hypothetical protein